MLPPVPVTLIQRHHTRATWRRAIAHTAGNIAELTHALSGLYREPPSLEADTMIARVLGHVDRATRALGVLIVQERHLASQGSI